MPTGFRVGRLPPERLALELAGRSAEVRYRARRDGTFAVTVSGAEDGEADSGEGEGEDRVARVHAWSPDRVDVEVDGRRVAAQVTRAGETLYVQTPRGTVAVHTVPRFTAPGAEAPSGGLVAPMPGVVLDVRCAAGDVVEANQTLVVLEAMKMEHHVRAPVAGTVAEVRVAKGTHIENGAVLLVLDAPEDP
jgi:propionyl-CoA carboxylase alpha chain